MSGISRISLIATLWLLALATPLYATDDKPQWQIWTAKDGKQISASLVAQGPNWVKLKREDNFKQFRLKLSDLGKADQEYLKKRWAAIQKRNNGIKALLAKFPPLLAKPIYRRGDNHFSFSPAKKGNKPYKTLEITRGGFYDRYERNFRFINKDNIVHQLENINSSISRLIKNQERKTGGVTLIALEAQLNKEWLEKNLKPYAAEWDKLFKATQYPAKPVPPKPKPKPKAEEKKPAPKPKAEAKATPAKTESAKSEEKKSEEKKAAAEPAKTESTK